MDNIENPVKTFLDFVRMLSIAFQTYLCAYLTLLNKNLKPLYDLILVIFVFVSRLPNTRFSSLSRLKRAARTMFARAFCFHMVFCGKLTSTNLTDLKHVLAKCCNHSASKQNLILLQIASQIQHRTLLKRVIISH